MRGGTTAYWVYGPEDAETTIVAVHGFRGEHHGLEPVLAFLPEARVIAPDLPGFGETAPLPGRTHDLDEYAAWLGDFVGRSPPAPSSSAIRSGRSSRPRPWRAGS